MKQLTKITIFFGVILINYNTALNASEEHTSNNLSSQTHETQNILSMSGYLETYYLHDFNRPNDEIRPSFTYSHNITDSPSIN